MKLSKYLINSIIIPFLIVLPMLSQIACTAEIAADTANGTLDDIGQSLTQLSGNVQSAAPYLQKDLEDLWLSVSGDIEVYAEEVGISNSSHPLAQAEDTRDKLIAGETFNEVLAKAANQLTTDDLENMPIHDLSALNGVLPFELNLDSCGENLAEVLNSLDIGQVSAILKSEAGFHLIQLLDRNGGSVRIGHVVFEVDPSEEVPESPMDTTAKNPDPFDEAMNKLTRVLEENWQ